MFKLNRAFTILEIIIVISIVTYLMSVVLYNYTVFNDRLSLTSAAKEMLIAIRQAQSYGINVREGAVGDFSRFYGIYVDPTNSPNSYYIFTDKNNNELYDDSLGVCSTSNECLEKIDLRNGISITSFSLTGSTCPGNNSARVLYVTFRRPNPDTFVYYTNAGGKVKTCPTSSNPTSIVLTSPKGNTLTISIEPTGQVSMQ